MHSGAHVVVSTATTEITLWSHGAATHAGHARGRLPCTSAAKRARLVLGLRRGYRALGLWGWVGMAELLRASAVVYYM